MNKRGISTKSTEPFGEGRKPCSWVAVQTKWIDTRTNEEWRLAYRNSLTCFMFQILALVLLALIPWPGPTVFKVSCPRERASVVRKVILKKWMPVLDRFHVSLPLECPFHPRRDIYGPQQAAKRQHRPSAWTCGFCGKSFYEEKFLDLHFDSRHKNDVNMAEDAVCLADYCDIMRCEVLVSQVMSSQFLNDNGHGRTDVDIWRETTAHRTALTIVGPRDLARVQQRQKTQQRPQPAPTQVCNKDDEGKQEAKHNPTDSDANATSDSTETCEDNLVDSALPPNDRKQARLSEMQKLKANCKPEQLNVLREHCEVLVQDCIAGLLVNLSDQDFKEVEDELNRAVCWYLTCDRYWEDTIGETRPFPWGLVFVLVMVLSLGLCLVYYVIWVLFDSDDGRGKKFQTQGSLGSDFAPRDSGAYVSYPPDLKRRLIESCYNRTTRL